GNITGTPRETHESLESRGSRQPRALSEPHYSIVRRGHSGLGRLYRTVIHRLAPDSPAAARDCRGLRALQLHRSVRGLGVGSLGSKMTPSITAWRAGLGESRYHPHAGGARIDAS